MALRLLILLCCLLSSGCQLGRSGADLGAQLSRPFVRLQRSLGADGLLARELRRGSFGASLRQAQHDPRQNLNTLRQAGQRLGRSLASRLGRLPGTLTDQELGAQASQGLHRAGTAVARNSPIAGLGRLLRRGQALLIRLPHRILSSPGDLDRAIDPDQTRNESGFLTRLLRRF